MASTNLNGFIFFCWTLAKLDIVVAPADVEGMSAWSFALLDGSDVLLSISVND